MEDNRGSVRPKKTSESEVHKKEKKTNTGKTRHKTREMHLDLQLIYLLFTEASGCQEAILKEGKRGEKAELCQMTQEED